MVVIGHVMTMMTWEGAVFKKVIHLSSVLVKILIFGRFQHFYTVFTVSNAMCWKKVSEKGQVYHRRCFVCCKCHRPQEDKLQVAKCSKCSPDVAKCSCWRWLQNVFSGVCWLWQADLLLLLLSKVRGICFKLLENYSFLFRCVSICVCIRINTICTCFCICVYISVP